MVSGIQTFNYSRNGIRDRNPFLLRAIAIPYGDGPILYTLAIDGNAKGSPDLVVLSISLANGLGLVELDRDALGPELLDNLLSALRVTILFHQRQDGNLHWRKTGMKFKHDPVLFLTKTW